MKLSDLPQRRTILAIGESGSGKTHLVGTLCQLLPTVVATADAEGLETLRQMGAEPAEIILLDDWSKSWENIKAIGEQAKNCRALAIDDFGGVQHSAKQHISRQKRASDATKLSDSQFREYVDSSLLLGKRRFELQQFGQLFISLDIFHTEILKSGFEVILTTVLEEVRTHPRTETEHVFPNVEGSLRYELGAYYGIVAHLYKEGGSPVSYALTTMPYANLPTKDRYTGKPRTWVNPSIADILTHINKEATSGKQQ